ncbi:MBL fold metallo-hydrolase [Pleionea litopenaei]|uniref:MBL fold metallo-hydrolase n=1 Tax=Pleionea litopenaei TaxID=3070815 RepID=A0AA51X592_9GAMM|nr:MBL fold metallo-hydrolase [Pleionea sp. HL-JVS1]WMS85747.1 MBL fold metallo-hydrolase [Pleionea sp. HL-JVS1]
MINHAITLYEDDYHKCLMFSDLVKGSGIQANQFMIVDRGRAAMIDPGGDLTFASLSIAIAKQASLDNVDFIFASHQDPDIIASLPKWIIKTPAKVVTSKLWSRFLPHLVPGYLTGQDGLNLDERMIALDDQGDVINLGQSKIVAVPAHFLHSVGNFQFFDMTSRILFSGDMGASLVDGSDMEPVEDFDSHVQSMAGFHRRYMTSNRACRIWARMVREMKVSMIVPQHGRPFKGEQMQQFLDWIENLECGVDLLTEQSYRPVYNVLQQAI